MVETEKQTVQIDTEANGRWPLDAQTLSLDRLEKVSSWGGSSSAMSYVYRPATVDGISRAFEVANRSGRNIGLRGAGNSYGDANLNAENIILDLGRMKRILDWDPSTGRIEVEPGVTFEQMWQFILEDGWWPPVVPGTAKPTIGGSAGMNVHGKNAWKAGTIGDHIDEFQLMSPNGNIVACSRENNSELFYSAIGGFGMLGVFTSLKLTMNRIHSGLLKVEALASSNLSEMLDQFEELRSDSDYLVGWIDGFAGGKQLGRGQIHRANYLGLDEDPHPEKTLNLKAQVLPDTLFGVVPRSIVWRFGRPFMNDLSWRFINKGKYWSSKRSHGAIYLQPHVAFHFLLDYLPDWKRAYGSGGLIQYQCFIPENNALDAVSEILAHCQKRRIRNYLSVLKRHKPDNFLISHGVEGYSLAMDFRVTPKRRPKIVKLAAELDEIVIESGGRFYFAKDSTLQPETSRAYLGDESIDTFMLLKNQYDPDHILQTNLWRRLFSEHG
jgi:FAD/FMN-containing dehydrogenase